MVKGDFDGISTGINGGQRRVRSVVNHEVSRHFNNDDPVEYLDQVAASAGADTPYFGFLTAVQMKNLCVVRDPYVTAFITAGISNPCHDPGVPGTINVLLVVHGLMTEGALASAIITATEAKAKTLFEMGFDFTGTTTDAVAVLTEERKTPVCEAPCYEYSGTATTIGHSIYRCVKKGSPRASGGSTASGRKAPCRAACSCWPTATQASTWIEKPDGKSGKGKCPYYPCHHFEGQDCTYCYCPLYPCEDPELGEWILSSKGYPVWTCKDCRLLHNKKAAGYLKKHPDACIDELKRQAPGLRR